MSSTTTNLGLTKPAYADEADIAVINGNMDLLDAAYGAINQSTMRPVPFAVAVSDWEAVTGGFSATYNSAYITATSQEILTYTKSIENAAAHIDAEKKSGGGGLVFTTAKKPTGTVQGTAYVFDNDDRTLPVIIEGTVTPIANGGTGQSSLAGAQSALGITALSEQIGNLEGLILTGTTTVVESLTTAGTSVSYTVEETGWYSVRASSANTSGGLTALMYNSNNNPLTSVFDMNGGSWATIFTAPLLLKVGTQIKAQFNGPTGSSGAIIKYT